MWKEGDVAAPAEADAREVMLAEPNADDGRSEVFEAPVETVEDASPDNPDSTAPVDVA